MIIKSNIFLQPRTSHYMEHELACLLCHKAASKITLHAQFSLPFPICLNEPVQAVSQREKGALMTVNLWWVEGERRGWMDRWNEGRNRERFKEVEKGQAQITLAVTRASGRKGEKGWERDGEILPLTAGVHKKIYLQTLGIMCLFNNMTKKQTLQSLIDHERDFFYININHLQT